MTTPAIDIVILFWNRWPETLAAVDSALAQTDVEPRVTVVNQASDPAERQGLLDGLKGRPGVTVVDLPKNVGVPAGRNIGAFLGTSDVIVFLDNDAEFDGTGVCRACVDRFARHPTTGILSFTVLNHETRDLDLTSWNHAQDPERWARTPFWTTRFPGGGFAIRRMTFEQAGGFDPALMFMEEEKDLGYRAIEAGWFILQDPSLRILHKISPEKRVSWSDGRTFFLTRNIVYCEHKYATSLASLVDATKNALRIAQRKSAVRDGVRGVLAGHLMGLRMHLLHRSKRCRLAPRTLAYIEEYEFRHYGAITEPEREAT